MYQKVTITQREISPPIICSISFMIRTCKVNWQWLIRKQMFGFLFSGYGALIYRTVLLNILVYGKIFMLMFYNFLIVKVNYLMVVNYTEPFYIIYLLGRWKIAPTKTITDVVMFDIASNVQLGGELLKNIYPKVTVMLEIFFSVVSKYQLWFGCALSPNIWWVLGFWGRLLDTDPSFGQYWHFCCTIINVCTDRKPNEIGTYHQLRQLRSA